MRRVIVTVPGIPDLDITNILPIVSHPIFTRLGLITQLSLIDYKYMAATGTRREHVFRTYYHMWERCQRWLKDNSITKEEAWALQLFALLHDTWHMPFSHTSEALCERSHNEYAILGLADLRKVIELCQGNFVLLQSLFAGTHPLAQALKHKPLGIDAMTYMVTDDARTCEGIKLQFGDLLNHVFWRNNQLVMGLNKVESIITAQHAYLHMYKEVYFRTSCKIAERALQQVMAWMMFPPTEKPELTEAELCRMVDAELITRIINSNIPKVKRFWQRWQRRELPKRAVVIRPMGSGRHEPIADKPIHVVEVPITFANWFGRYERPQHALALEEGLAELLGLPPDEVLVVATPPSERFRLADIPIVDGSREVGTLKEHRPAHYAAMAETATTFGPVLRVCVPESHRKRVANRSAEVAGYVVNHH